MSLVSAFEQPAAAVSAAPTDLPVPLPGTLPRPRITWKGLAIAALLWSLYALLFTLPVLQMSRMPFLFLFIGQLQFSLCLGLLSLPAWWLVIRGMDERRWGWKLLAHAAIAPLYGWASLQFLFLMARTDDGAVLPDVAQNSRWIYATYVTLYVLQFAIYHTVRAVQRLKVREQQAAELMALARERELAALKAQLNPHFLFNTLNSISAMVSRDAEATREMIAHLADLLRYVLESDRRNLVPLQAEVQFARAYLALEARRFSDRLRVRFDIDPDVLDTPVPPMLLQPLVENAVKHGIAPSETGGEVVVSARAEGRSLYVCVEDTAGTPAADGGARPVPATVSNGIGLANTSARLERLFGPGAALQAAVLPGAGFKVSCHLPRP